MCEETKNRALAQAFFREEIIVNQSQKKARSKYGICAGFWFDRRGHKAKRSNARFIYISLIFLANILCVHVRKFDEMYASWTWFLRMKKKNATEVTVSGI